MQWTHPGPAVLWRGHLSIRRSHCCKWLSSWESEIGHLQVYSQLVPRSHPGAVFSCVNVSFSSWSLRRRCVPGTQSSGSENHPFMPAPCGHLKAVIFWKGEPQTGHDSQGQGGKGVHRRLWALLFTKPLGTLTSLMILQPETLQIQEQDNRMDSSHGQDNCQTMGLWIPHFVNPSGEYLLLEWAPPGHFL